VRFFAAPAVHFGLRKAVARPQQHRAGQAVDSDFAAKPTTCNPTMQPKQQWQF
jgi:hypothetical protein